jgi:hypothetical protein
MTTDQRAQELTAVVTRDGWRGWLALAAALLLLNATLSFENLWPTPAIRWNGELSIELAVAVLALLAARSRFGVPSRAALRALSWFWVVLIVGHYADVTAAALFGRDLNLYWDLRFVPDISAFMVRGAPLGLAVSIGIGTLLTFLILYGLVRWAWGRVADAAASRLQAKLLAWFAAAAVVMFVAVHLTADASRVPIFSKPVTQTYARQIRLTAQALAGRTSLPASPAMNSNFSRAKDADVFLIFLESYGAVSYDRPEFVEHLAPARKQFEEAIRGTGRDVVSAYVESPTFGGSSWLAHINLLSGLEIRNPDQNALLMTQHRDTLVGAFARHDYRTVALMPALIHPWPEGAFYGFDEIYTNDRLAYRGPLFGWFDMSDQSALARFDALELRHRTSITMGSPLFVFFPTISTHTPFSPVPPYQPDWRRAATDHPYDQPDLDRALAKQPDWLNLGPAYVDALTYAYATIGGYLRVHADRDLVMIVIGDHQPPALVTGPGASWDVPVHVISSRRAILDRLLAAGFRAGLGPERPVRGPMSALLPILLDAFGGRQTSSITASH